MIHGQYGWCVVAEAIDRNDPTVAMIAYKVKGTVGLTFGILSEHSAVSLEERDPELEIFRKLLLGES